MEQSNPADEGRLLNKRLDDSPQEDSPASKKVCGTMLNTHLELLARLPEKDELDEIVSAPLFTYPVFKHAENLSRNTSNPPFSQYSLLAGDSESLQKRPSEDSRVF